MAVYDGVNPTHLAEALTGLHEQTLTPHEVIIVADGPITGEQGAVLDAFATTHRWVRRIDRSVRRGAGPARQAGLVAATCEWIAIFDADDISLPQRLERQMASAARLQVDVLGAAMEEFDDLDGRVLGIRQFPTEHDEVRRMLRTLNPINQPATLVRRKAVLSAGGYRDLPMLEDYELWVRMMGNGARFANLPEVLVRFRGGAQVHRRRTSPSAFASEYRLQQALVRAGLVGRTKAMQNWVTRSAYRLLPDRLGRVAYRRLFLNTPKPPNASASRPMRSGRDARD